MSIFFLRRRKGVSPVISTIILIGMGFILSSFFSLYFRETAFAQVKVEAIEYAYIYSTRNTDIENASWKVVLYVINRGTEPLDLINVFVNEQEVNVYGLIHGESLMSGFLTGTSLPLTGLNLRTGEGVEIYIWIGDQLFSAGTNIVVSLNPINNVTQYKTVTLY
jgi:flagellin-like protein